jgi:hypothetical protein
MQLRNGKQTLENATANANANARMLENRARSQRNVKANLEYNVTAHVLERVLVADGYQTSRNLRGLKRTFEMSDAHYLKMLKGFAREYGYKIVL